MSWLWSRKSQEWNLDEVEAPWAEKESLYSYVQSHIVEGKPGLGGEAGQLPDIEDSSPLSWAAGAQDGSYSYHFGDEPPVRQVRKLHRLLHQTLSKLTSKRLKQLYDSLLQVHTIEIMDALLNEIMEQEKIDPIRLEEFALWLIKTAPDREPVKFGIGLLNLFQEKDYNEILLTLGRHDEFTLYCAVALKNRNKDPEVPLFELAQSVHGWGRVHTVALLVEVISSPEIRQWLLLEGYKNEVMHEYLAYSCAVAGELRQALNAKEMDEQHLVAIAGLLRALLNGGPVESMEHYEDGVAVIEGYLYHLGSNPQDLEHFFVLAQLESFLNRLSSESSSGEEIGEGYEEFVRHRQESLEELGWTSEVQARLLHQVTTLLNLPHWREHVTDMLQQNDLEEYHPALQAAEVLKIDLWNWHFERIQEGKGHEVGWLSVAETTDPSRMAKVVALAEKQFPLEKMKQSVSSEPLSEMSSLFEQLSFVVYQLSAFPSLGWPLVKVCLQSPTDFVRAAAIETLAAWGHDHWPVGASELLRQLRRHEPDEDLRAMLTEILPRKS